MVLSDTVLSKIAIRVRPALSGSHSGFSKVGDHMASGAIFVLSVLAHEKELPII